MEISFKNLSVWDLGIIKHLAIDLLKTTKINDRYVALTETVIGCIKAKGFNILYDEKSLIQNISKSFTRDREVHSTYKPRSSYEVIYSIFEYLKSNNIVIIKDETREVTWSKEPRPLEYIPYYKPWMITWKN